MKFLERRSCLGQEAKGEGTGHRAGQGSTDIPKQIQPEKRSSAWTRCVWTGEITFSPTLDLEADQTTEVFTTTFGWGGMKRQLLPPFCLATFLIFSRGVAALHPAHCVCVCEEFTVGGKNKIWISLWNFFPLCFLNGCSNQLILCWLLGALGLLSWQGGCKEQRGGLWDLP